MFCSASVARTRIGSSSVSAEDHLRDVLRTSLAYVKQRTRSVKHKSFPENIKQGMVVTVL